MPQVTSPKKTPLATGVTNPPLNTRIDTTVHEITIHIFFDGTANNYYNSEARRDPDFKNKDRPNTNNVSYENYYSNIALLYLAMQETEYTRKIYIEGAGTTKYGVDSALGLGLAAFSSGLEARYKVAINELESKIAIGQKNYANITLNVYGFSRGAAWARYFCSQIKQDSKRKNVKINFVGLLDTVSSDGFFHYNDVEKLGLDIGKPQKIGYILHLTAQNDYRKHFPLTSIKGALKDGIGFECSLLGAHSDIGGGYSEKYIENKLLWNGPPSEKPGILSDDQYIDYNWFIKKGYYLDLPNDSKNNQVYREKNMVSASNKQNNKPTAIKPNTWPIQNKQFTEYPFEVPNKVPQLILGISARRETSFLYQFICYEILRDVAFYKANYKISEYTKSKQNAMKNLRPYLNLLHSTEYIKKYAQKYYNFVLANYINKRGQSLSVPAFDPEDSLSMFNKYIHNSLDYNKIANNGTIENKNKLPSGLPDYTSPKRPTVDKGYR